MLVDSDFILCVVSLYGFMPIKLCQVTPGACNVISMYCLRSVYVGVCNRMVCIIISWGIYRSKLTKFP